MSWAVLSLNPEKGLSIRCMDTTPVEGEIIQTVMNCNFFISSRYSFRIFENAARKMCIYLPSTHFRVRKTVCNIRLGTAVTHWRFLIFMASFIPKNCITYRVRVVSALHSRMRVYNSDALLMTSPRPTPCCLFRWDSQFILDSKPYLAFTFVPPGAPSHVFMLCLTRPDSYTVFNCLGYKILRRWNCGLWSLVLWWCAIL